MALNPTGNAQVGRLEPADARLFLSNFPMFGEQTLSMDDFEGKVDVIQLRRR